METIEKHVDVNVPVQAAYNQWTQFESFPQFMEGVKEVRQLDDKHLHWLSSVGGDTEEWDAEIMEQIPDQKIAWRSTSGKENAGAVTFEPIDVNTTRVKLQMAWQPEGVMQRVGSTLGMDDRRVEGDLRRFKEFVESRGHETGAWRGNISS